MRGRRRLGWSTLPVVLVIGLVGASDTHAYKLGGKKWSGRTITYHSSIPEYDAAIRDGVRAWNTSGVRIQFKRVPKRRAQLKIVICRQLGHGGAGEATLGAIGRGAIVRREIEGVPIRGYPVPCGTRMPGPSGRRATVRCLRGAHVWLSDAYRSEMEDPRTRNEVTRIVVHELGHVLGLLHVKGCAVMERRGGQSCEQPEQPWQLRCRLLEADDVRGAIRRYGGSMRPLAEPFCEVPAPEPVSGVTASWIADGRRIAVRWTNPMTPTLEAARISAARDSCPEPPSYPFATAKPGAPGSFELEGWADEGGRYCVAVWAEDKWSRLSPPATTWIDVPPPSEPEGGPRPGRPPTEEEPVLDG